MRKAVIVPIGELGNLFPQMLAGYVGVRALDRTVEVRPAAFDRVRVVFTPRPFLLRMVHGAVLIGHP